MGGQVMTLMLGTGLGGGRPPPAAPAAAAAAGLVRVITPAKVQHKERGRSHGASTALYVGGQVARDGGLPAHAASPPLGPPKLRWRRWRARSTARSISAAVKSWRRRRWAARAAARWQDLQ
jgi:hypothetical protein